MHLHHSPYKLFALNRMLVCQLITNVFNLTGCPEICNNDYSPVCGTDGTTYSNVCHLTQTACVMESADLIIDYEGECRGKML